MDKIKEIRKESCSVASKLVVVTIYRDADQRFEGEIVGFECDSSASTCEGKCLYRQLLEDF